MRKPFKVTAILISLVLIFLSKTVPPSTSRLPKDDIVTLTVSSNSEKPVKFHSKGYNRHFINGLATYSFAAHRGAPIISNEPENSLPAFIAAKKMGYTIVETDLQLTKDGQWIIMHDYTLDRTTNGKGSVSSHYLNDIQRLKLKEKGNEKLTIPTLEDFLKLCKNEGLIPILDIKPDGKHISPNGYDRLLTTLDKYDLLDKSIFCSYSKEVLTELRDRDDITTIAVMMDATEDNLNLVKKLDNAFIYCNYKNLTDEQMALINIKDIQYGVWTINDEDTAKYFLNKGALIVVSDKLKKKSIEQKL